MPNNRLVTIQTKKGHKKYVMTRFQIFSSFWIECRCQDTKACCHWCPVPGWGRCAVFISPDPTGILETSDPKIVLRSAVKRILDLECRDTTSVTSPSCWASVTSCLMSWNVSVIWPLCQKDGFICLNKEQKQVENVVHYLYLQQQSGEEKVAGKHPLAALDTNMVLCGGFLCSLSSSLASFWPLHF